MKRKLLVLSLCLLMAMGLSAEDEFSSFADEGMSSFGGEDDSAPSLVFSGIADASFRYYCDGSYAAQEKPVEADPALRLNMDYSGDSVDFDAKLKLSRSILTTYPKDVLDELTIRGYFGDFVVEAGKMKVVWGKGDKLHVLDNFNANDYTDFIMPDYIDRRLAMPMLKVAYNGLSAARFELVYTPFMVADRYSSSGTWVPGQYLSMNSAISQMAETHAASDYSASSQNYSHYKASIRETYISQVMASAGLTRAVAEAYVDSTLASSVENDTKSALSAAQTTYLSSVSSGTNLYPNLYQLQYGQAGLRATGTVGSFDWGASYFVGRMKQPSINQTKLVSWVTNPSSSSSPLEYDLVQVFGLEGACALGPFNTRGELAYNMTNDTAGTDPYVHNNSIAWVWGFDVGIPLNNMSLNVQTTGTVLMAHDSIKENGSGDVDYDKNGLFSNDKIVLSLSDTYFHEKLKAEVNGVWGIERGDVIVMPKLTYTPKEGLDLSLAGMYIYAKDDNSEFSSFGKNGFLQAKVAYSF